MNDEDRIRQVLAQFVQLRDDKRFGEWVDLFTEDATFEYPANVLMGRTAIRENVQALLRDDRGKHLCGNSIIDVADDGVGAEVSSDVIKLDPAESAAPGRFEIVVAGRYYDRFVREEDTWKIARRRVVLMPPH